MHRYTADSNEEGSQFRGTQTLLWASAVSWGVYLFNTRNSELIPSLGSLPYMQDCPVTVNLTMLDNGNSHKGAISSYREAFLYPSWAGLSENAIDVVQADIYSSRTKSTFNP
jgi:hypothetical protein